MSQQQDRSLSVPPPIVTLAGWLVPGAGYWLIGQRARAITVGVTILVLFICGLLIGGMRVLESSENLWFIQQIFAGPVTFLARKIGQIGDLPFSHGRMAEIGTLYCAIAGDLNLLAIIDSSYRAADREHS